MTTPSSAPLSPQTFYILLALSRGQSHAYALKHRVADASLGAIKMADGTLYPQIKRLISSNLIEEAGYCVPYYGSQERLHYSMTDLGLIKLKSDLLRQRHSIEIAHAEGFLNDELPLETQKLLARLK